MSVASILAALGDESRLEIVRKLCKHGPLSIVRLAEGAEISRQGITKHLHALQGPHEVLRHLAHSRQWEDALCRLGSHSRERTFALKCCG